MQSQRISNPTKFKKEIAPRLKKIARQLQVKRQAMEISQENLAERLEVSPLTIQAIENCRRYPSLAMLISICDVLGLKLELK
jgi:DNA-binding XRE family transcriptional regulator